MSILVTGGAGFIGGHVVDRLVAAGHAVTVLDNLDPQVHGPDARAPAWLPREVRFVHGDVRDAAAVTRALDGVDTIIHLAAAVGVGQSMYAPHYYTSVNVDGQGVLMEVLAREPARWRRLVVASSMSIYGEGAATCGVHGTVAPAARASARLAAGEWDPVCPSCGSPVERALTAETKPLDCTSIYAVTKKAQEEMALCFGAAYDLPATALRFFNVYGSRQALSNPYTGVAAIFLARLKNGAAPLVFEDGAQTRDFIHVHDVADAVVVAATATADVTGAFNVCTGRAVSIAGVAEVLAQSLGVQLAPQLVGRYRTGDIRHCVGDPERARAALGFAARTDFATGLRELIDWASGETAEDRVAASLVELERQRLVR